MNEDMATLVYKHRQSLIDELDLMMEDGHKDLTADIVDKIWEKLQPTLAIEILSADQGNELAAQLFIPQSQATIVYELSGIDPGRVDERTRCLEWQDGMGVIAGEMGWKFDPINFYELWRAE